MARVALLLVSVMGLLGAADAAFFTNEAALVSRCPRNRREIISGCAYGGVQYGVCSDCSQATRTGRHNHGHCVGYTYTCDRSNSRERPCETRMVNIEMAVQTGRDLGSQWSTTCPWGLNAEGGYMFFYKDCPRGYRMETYDCRGLFDTAQRPACVCW